MGVDGLHFQYVIILYSITIYLIEPYIEFDLRFLPNSEKLPIRVIPDPNRCGNFAALIGNAR